MRILIALLILSACGGGAPTQTQDDAADTSPIVTTKSVDCSITTAGVFASFHMTYMTHNIEYGTISLTDSRNNSFQGNWNGQGSSHFPLDGTTYTFVSTGGRIELHDDAGFLTDIPCTTTVGGQ